jgi:hypothetical protein
MILANNTSSYVHRRLPTTSAQMPAGNQQTKTDQDTQKEADHYTNSEVPRYNKLFIGTMMLVGFLIFNQLKENE